MSKHTVKINEAYFADLGTRYRNEFSNVNDAISYVNSTKELDQGMYIFTLFSRVIKSRQNSLDYDITCISSVFSATDAEMKKRASELIGDEIINGLVGGVEITTQYYDPSLKPNLDSPRKLKVTQYGYESDDNGNQVYDHPKELEEYLYRQQGSAYKGKITGTCGLCSCANILRMAGVNYDEKEMVDYAVKNGLCDTGYSNPGDNGGTSAYEREKILEAYGIPCSCVDPNVNTLANSVEQGKGVIISVDPGKLCPSVYDSGFHAITVTSVVKDSSGKVVGFYVCDSNAGKNSSIPNYYTADQINKAFTGNPMVVTDSPIR